MKFLSISSFFRSSGTLGSCLSNSVSGGFSFSRMSQRRSRARQCEKPVRHVSSSSHSQSTVPGTIESIASTSKSASSSFRGASLKGSARPVAHASHRRGRTSRRRSPERVVRSPPPRRVVSLPPRGRDSIPAARHRERSPQRWARPQRMGPTSRTDDAKVSTAQAEARFDRKCYPLWSGPTREALEEEQRQELEDFPPPPIQFEWQLKPWYEALRPSIRWQIFNNPSFTRELKYQTLPEGGSPVNCRRSSLVILQRLAYSPSFKPQYVWVKSPAGCDWALAVLNRILLQETRPQGSLDYTLFGLDTEFFSYLAFNSWRHGELGGLYGKQMDPLEKERNGPHLIFITITAPGFGTFIFELKYLVVASKWDTLETVGKKEKEKVRYSDLPEALRKFLVDSRIIFATCDGQNDMLAINRFCGLGSRENQPGNNMGQIGYVDIQSWAAKDLKLLKLGAPDPVSLRRQKHPPGLIELVAYGLSGTLEKTDRTASLFEAKKRKQVFDFSREKAMIFLRKMSAGEKEYVVLDPAFTLFAAYSLLFMHHRRDAPQVLREIRQDLFTRFSAPIVLSRLGLAKQYSASLPCLHDCAKEVAVSATSNYLVFQRKHPGEGFVFQLDHWDSLHGRFGFLADHLNGGSYPRIGVDQRIGALHSFFELIHQAWRRRFKAGRALNPVVKDVWDVPSSPHGRPRGEPRGHGSRSRSPVAFRSASRSAFGRRSRRNKNRSRRNRTQSFGSNPRASSSSIIAQARL